MIKYKAELYGREFVQIDRWFPSSKKCHVCGEINHDLGREEREWECPHCHAVHQRDVNAAKKHFRRRSTRHWFNGAMLSRFHA